jgi:signal transduction histidine kinase
LTNTHFRFSPNILARLGEELNQAVDQSILELIKNSYDADASICEITLKGTAKPGGSILIRDNGVGMDIGQIQNSWLVLGKSEKASGKLTNLGRVPAGNKGLGRLAALRMGKQVNLRSISAVSPLLSHHLKVDWGKFENANTVEDVNIAVNARFGIPYVPKYCGTEIAISDLREAISSDALKKLARAVLLLMDPFEDKKTGFEVILKSPEFSEISKLLEEKYFEDAQYHLVCELDSDGFASASLQDWQGNILTAARHFELKGNEEPYECSAVNLNFWVFLLGGGSFLSGRKTKDKDLRAWLKNFGGVHVYQDSIRVSPYGSPGDDWLGINLARVKSPEERPGTHTSIGKISVSNKGRYHLTQKTDRSGFIEDENFLALKSFAKDSLEWMAKWRLAQAEKRRATERTEAPKAGKEEGEKFEKVLLEAPPSIKNKLLVAFKSYENSRDRETESLRREVQLYRTLSTAGITAATFAHESQGNPIKVIDLSVNVLERRILKYVDIRNIEKLNSPVNDIRNATGSLSTLSAATLNLVKAQKRRIGKVEINDILLRIADLMEPFLRGRDTILDIVACEENPFLQCSEAALESIFTNLINNSLNAFRRSFSKNRVIKIQTQVADGCCNIVVMDTGPGISIANLNEIWLPGITSDPDGTGLGLTIVKDTIKDLGGKIDVVRNSMIGGAEFSMTIPIIGW